MASKSAQVYSETRPPYAGGPQTPLFGKMQDYANKPYVQELLQKLCSDMFTDRPEDPLEYIGSWVEKEKVQQSLQHNKQH